MSLTINPAIQALVKTTYAVEEAPDAATITIDCGDGINVLSQSPLAKEVFGQLSFDLAKGYPQTVSLKDAIIQRWANHATLQRHHIMLTEGSIAGIFLANRLLLEPGCKVLGNQPTFSETEMDVRASGAHFVGVPLDPQAAFAFNVEALLAQLTPDIRYVYIDNPNNPTGQILSLGDLERVARKAADLGMCVVIDEAYGEYMPPSNSAIALIDELANVIVLRTFSKGYGLAGLRAGYMVYSDELAGYVPNITCPYNISAVSREIAVAVLADTEFLPAVIRQTRTIKRQILDMDLERLSIAHTDETVSIMLMMHANPELNLTEAFAQHKIKVVPAESFSGIGINAVRLRIPGEDDLPAVMAAIREIDAREA